jgi:hypothetical protein
MRTNWSQSVGSSVVKLNPDRKVLMRQGRWSRARSRADAVIAGSYAMRLLRDHNSLKVHGAFRVVSSSPTDKDRSNDGGAATVGAKSIKEKGLVPVEPDLRLKTLATDSPAQDIRGLQQMGHLPFMGLSHHEIDQFYCASGNQVVEDSQLCTLDI